MKVLTDYLELGFVCLGVLQASDDEALSLKRDRVYRSLEAYQGAVETPEETPKEKGWRLYRQEKYREALRHCLANQKPGVLDCSEVLGLSILKIYNVHDTVPYCLAVKYLEEGIKHLGDAPEHANRRKELATIVKHMRRLGYNYPIALDLSKSEENPGCFCCF